MQAINAAKDKAKNAKNAAEEAAAKGASASMGVANKATGGAAGKAAEKGAIAGKLVAKGAEKGAIAGKLVAKGAEKGARTGISAGVTAVEYVPEEAKRSVQRLLIGTFTSVCGCANCCLLFLIFLTGLVPLGTLVKVFPMGTLTVDGDYDYTFRGEYADGSSYAYVGQAKDIKVVKNYGLLGNHEQTEGEYILDGEETWTWFATTISKGKSYHCGRVADGGLAGLFSKVFCVFYEVVEGQVTPITNLEHPNTRDDQRSLIAATMNNPLNSLMWGDLPPEIEVSFVLDKDWPCNQSEFPPTGLVTELGACPAAHDIGELAADCTETEQICEKNRPSAAHLKQTPHDKFITSFSDKSGHAGRTCNDFWFLAMFMSCLSLLCGLFGSICCFMRLWPWWDTAGKGGTQAIAASTLVLMGAFGWGIQSFFDMTCGQNQWSKESYEAGIETWTALPIGKMMIWGLGGVSILVGPKLHQMLPPGTNAKPHTHTTKSMAPKFQG